MHAWFYHLSCCTRSAVWHHAIESVGTVVVSGEWSIVISLYCSHIVAASLHALQTLTVLPACTSCKSMMALMSGALETCVCTLRTCVPSSQAGLLGFSLCLWPTTHRRS
jgi:hypothetical protein